MLAGAEQGEKAQIVPTTPGWCSDSPGHLWAGRWYPDLSREPSHRGLNGQLSGWCWEAKRNLGPLQGLGVDGHTILQQKAIKDGERVLDDSGMRHPWDHQAGHSRTLNQGPKRECGIGASHKWAGGGWGSDAEQIPQKERRVRGGGAEVGLLGHQHLLSR